MGNSVNTEEYNGTAWTDVNDMVAHKRSNGSAGTQTAGFAAGGNPSAQYQVTHEYDGTSWTVGGAILTARNYNGTWGSLTAGITVGNGSYSATAEEYDGTCWSAVDNEPSGKGKSFGLGQATGGTDGLHHGGEDTNGTTYLNSTYQYSASLTARSVTAS